MNAVYLESVKLEEVEGSWFVTPVWGGVDRKEAGGISTGKNLKLAQRLVRAWYAGAIYDANKVTAVADVNGKTFASVFVRVLGRTLNADLKRVGF